MKSHRTSDRKKRSTAPKRAKWTDLAVASVALAMNREFRKAQPEEVAHAIARASKRVGAIKGPDALLAVAKECICHS